MSESANVSRPSAGRHKVRRPWFTRLFRRRSCPPGDHATKRPIVVGAGIVRTSCRRCGEVIIDLTGAAEPKTAKVIDRKPFWE